MNDSPLQSTLRELQGLSRDARFWTVLVVIALIVGLVGPFGTYQVLAVAPRLAYWGVVVLGTALTGTLVVGFIERLLRPRLNKYLAALLAGALPGPLLAAMVALINIAVFGPGVTSFDLLTLGVYCTLISAAVTLVSAVLERPAQPDPAHVPPALLGRLPRPQRGPIRRISVADHYVEVTTDKGSSLVLMRLSDAIKKPRPSPDCRCIAPTGWRSTPSSAVRVRRAGRRWNWTMAASCRSAGPTSQQCGRQVSRSETDAADHR